MKFSINKGSDRFHTEINWLNAYHYFSFGQHYDKNRTSFGALVVVNDDTIAPHSGFDTHSHRDMEIITIPFLLKEPYHTEILQEVLVKYLQVKYRQ